MFLEIIILMDGITFSDLGEWSWGLIYTLIGRGFTMFLSWDFMA